MCVLLIGAGNVCGDDTLDLFLLRSSKDFLFLSHLSPRLPREVGLIISISQMSVCHDSLRGSDTRLLAPPGLGGAHAPLSSLSSGPVAPRFLDDRDGLAYCEGCSELQDHGS